MDRKNGFLTFIFALIPGVGYMYYGLVKKGAEALIIFLLIPPVFGTLGMGWVGSIIRLPLWFYFFFDTFNVANKYSRGDTLQDSGLFIKDDRELNAETIKNINKNLPQNKWILLAWILIILGIYSVLNQILGMEVFYTIRAIIRNSVIPVLLILLGIYLLFKSSKKKL